MTDLSREKVRASNERVYINDGGITQAHRNALSITGPGGIDGIDALREQLGALVEDFATKLDTDTRSGFELVQNPEDSKHEAATTKHSEPSVTFRLSPPKVIVDSNEDGLHENNVKAICKLGDSTKKERHGYCGEKGIGFKSVFKVASNVYIQSGLFSFFEYPKGDSGMGMLTPFYQQHFRDIPQGVRTWMILKLASHAIVERLLEGFSELPDSLLMSLSKAKNLTVATHSSSRPGPKIIYSYETTATLEKYSEVVGWPGKESSRRYHITKRIVRNLPEATTRPKTNQVEIILAFPSDPVSTPVIKQQYVFAYLPVPQIHFSYWLEKFPHVQHIPRLMKRVSTDVADVFLYIIKNQGDKSIEQSSQACVVYESVANTPLRDTYMPIPKLKQVCKELGVGNKLPFLKLPIATGVEPEREWDFLNTSEVGRKADISFYLEILQVIVQENRDLNSDLSMKTRKSIFKVYEEIEKQSKPANRGEIAKFFTNNEAVYVPAKGPRQAVWTSPDRCVWKAPGFFDQCFALASAEGYQGNDHLQRLFNVILGIVDTGYDHYLAQLSTQKERPDSLPIILDIYHHILLDAPDEASWTRIREHFERCSLVYVPSQQQWHPPYLCLWTDKTRIWGKFAIATQYDELYEFFVRRLSVQLPELPMFVNDLIRVAENDQRPNLLQVKNLIRDINSLSPTEEALVSLQSCNILPVRGLDGRICLKNTTDTFAIMDRLHYGDLFGAKIPVLDFGLKEVHELGPFLSALSLGSRYMTRAIEEATTANDSTIDLMLSRQMQEKAFALFRCAVHYGCAKPQDQSLYRRLLAIDVYRSSNITRSITISLCGTHATVEGVSANLHIEIDVSRIRLFVPQDEEQRELCYLCQIPQIFVSRFNIMGPAASKVIGDLVRATRTTILNSLLNEHGIASVPGISPLPPAAVIEATVAVRPTLVNRLPTISYSPQSPMNVHGRVYRPPRYQRSPSPDLRRYRESSTEDVSPVPTTYSFGSGYGTSVSSVSPGQLSGRVEAVPKPPAFRNWYLDLLHQVVTIAAQADFPVYSPTTPTPVVDTDCDALPDDVFGQSSDGQMGYDANVAAAGELYVFEMLGKQNLIGFGRHNWKSTIRDKVCGLERYKDMQPWRGAETADIVYEDVGPDFKLTKLLESLGYLRAGNSPVTYYLDIKTTKKECGTPFLVSRAQYQRMRRMTLHTGQSAAEVYIILRVFNLGKANVGMRLYVDPATMGEEGGLIFEAESCTVVPTSSPAISANAATARAFIEDSNEDL